MYHMACMREDAQRTQRAYLRCVHAYTARMYVRTYAGMYMRTYMHTHARTHTHYTAASLLPPNKHARDAMQLIECNAIEDMYEEGRTNLGAKVPLT